MLLFMLLRKVAFLDLPQIFSIGHNATNPQQAWDIYKKGYGGSVLGELFNKYRIKVSFLQDNVEHQSLEI